MKLYILIIALAFTSCITQEKCSKRFPCLKESDSITKDSINYTRHDSLIYTAPDSAYIKAYLGCIDENGKLTGDKVKLIQLIAYKSGNRVNLPQVQIKDNVLSVLSKVDSVKIAISWFNKYVYRNVKIKQVAVNVEYRQKSWQAALMWAGIVFTGLLFIGLCYFIIKAIIKGTLKV